MEENKKGQLRNGRRTRKMGCHKMAEEHDVSGRKEWSPLLNFSERSNNTRTENCPLGSAKWRVRQSVDVCLSETRVV